MERRVVIVGGGFGGLHAARELRRAPVRVDLVDRRNFHLFQPLLYQVATGGLGAANIAAPLRRVLARQKNAHVLLGEAQGFDLDGRRLRLADGDLPYDFLIVAAGMENHYFGHDDWAPLAPGLKTLEDAAEMRRRILLALESAEREPDPAVRRAWLTFVVVGAGPTGVELAGTLGEIARFIVGREFRGFSAKDVRILLVEGVGRALPTFHESLSRKAEAALRGLRVEFRPNTFVTDVREDAVVLGEEHVPCRTVLWAAGVRASPLGRALADAAGAETDKTGRVVVAPDLSVPGRPEVFVIGDLALCRDADGEPLPGMAPVAIQQGRHVARAIRSGRRRPFRYRDHGMMATIGRKKAVADIRGWRFGGLLAWLLWLFVHLIQLVLYETRLLVLVQWAWNYFTFSRSARIIVRWPR